MTLDGKTMRSVRLISLSVLVSFALFFAGFAGEQHLIILHTNDIHASFLPHEAMWINAAPRPTVGGFVRLQEAVDSVRGTGNPCVLLDAGDVMTGNPISDMVYGGAEGGALFAMMNRIGYDAWCPGNHEFDISVTNLRKLGMIARFPMVSANLVDEHGDYPVANKPYTIIERGGFSVGVIGLMSQELSSLVLQQNLVGIKVLSLPETAQKWIDEIRPKVDLVVLLTHEGADEDSQLAGQVRNVDVIVGGHSHTRLRTPRVVNGICIVQAGSNCENLGVLDVTFSDRKPVRYAGSLTQLWADAKGVRGSVASLVDSVRESIDRTFSEVIGTLTEDWGRSDGDNSLVTFIAEAQRTVASADVSFMNVHGVRKDLSKGPVTKRDLFEVLPFRNVLTTFQLSGRDLKGIIQFMLDQRPAVVMTGVSGTWRRMPSGTLEFPSVEVRGRPLDDERMYVCTASDYIVGEARKYLGRDIRSASYSRTTLYEAVEQCMRQEGTLKPPQQNSLHPVD